MPAGILIFVEHFVDIKQNMLPIIWSFVRAYAPIIMLPVSITIGAVGYNLEWFAKKGVDQAKDKPSISTEREDRLLKELLDNKKEAVVNKNPQRTIFDKN